jgi:protein TonB
MSLRALLFCPDEKTAKVVAQVLSDVDFTVEQAAEPFAAVKKLSSQSFDALVVECANEQNASLLMKSARNSASNTSSLIVALVEGQIGVANAFRIGANLVLTKPIAVEQAKSTLRVARGLLRKGADPSLAPATTPKPAAPAKGIASPVPPRPPAPSLPAPGTPTNTLPATPRPTTTPAPAMTGNFEVEAESVPKLDAADTSLLESMGSVAPPAAAAPTRQLAPRPATGITKPAAWPIESSSPRAPQVPEPELTTLDSAFSAASALPTVEAPVSTASASAAAAPARIPAPPQGAESEMPVAYPDFPELHPKEDVESRRKAPFIAAVAILFVAAALYFGWSMLRSTAKTTPKPVEPVVNNGGFPTAPAADTTLPAPANTNPAPAKTAPAPETITKFVVPSETANAENAGKTALQVHSEKRETRPAPDTSDTVAAPALGSVASNDPGTALNSLVAHPPTALPSESPQDVRISQGVSQGLLLKRVQPIYPAQARQARIEGAVELTATITKDGSTRDVKVISGPALLGKVAVDAVRQWKYKPYFLNGEPVEVQTQIVLNFKLPN